MDEYSKYTANKKKIKFRPHSIGNESSNKQWILAIVLLSFALSASLQFFSSHLLKDVPLIISFIIVFTIIIIGIIFDIIGIAVTAAEESPFHAMASRKVYGAKSAIGLIRNANKVSSFCNDVIGDICGIISGTASAYIVLQLAEKTGIGQTALLGTLFSGLLACMTIGGKAMGKTYAIRHCNHIVYRVAVLVGFTGGGLGLVSNRKRKKKNKS